MHDHVRMCSFCTRVHTMHTVDVCALRDRSTLHAGSTSAYPRAPRKPGLEAVKSSVINLSDLSEIRRHAIQAEKFTVSCCPTRCHMNSNFCHTCCKRMCAMSSRQCEQPWHCRAQASSRMQVEASQCPVQYVLMAKRCLLCLKDKNPDCEGHSAQAAVLERKHPRARAPQTLCDMALSFVQCSIAHT